MWLSSHEFWWHTWKIYFCAQTCFSKAVKVSKSRKQFMVSSILPKNEQNSLSWAFSLLRKNWGHHIFFWDWSHLTFMIIIKCLVISTSGNATNTYIKVAKKKIRLITLRCVNPWVWSQKEARKNGSLFVVGLTHGGRRATKARDHI